MRVEVAKTICGKVDAVFSQLHDLLSYIDDQGAELPVQEFRQASAACVTELDLEILERIYQAHPQYRPEDLQALDNSCRRVFDQGS